MSDPVGGDKTRNEEMRNEEIRNEEMEKQCRSASIVHQASYRYIGRTRPVLLGLGSMMRDRN